MGVGAELKPKDVDGRAFAALLYASAIITFAWGMVLVIGTAELFIAIISKFVSISTP